MNFNEWANYVGFGSMYKSPSPPPPNCHYFDMKVFKQSLKPKKSVMRTLKKLLGLAVIVTVMSSCNTIRNVGGGGCGVWMPKKFSGMPKMRSGARMPTF